MPIDFENLSPDANDALAELIKERLRHNGYRFGQTVLEILEIEIPEGVDPLEFEDLALGDLFGAISESYSDETDS